VNFIYLSNNFLPPNGNDHLYQICILDSFRIFHRKTKNIYVSIGNYIKHSLDLTLEMTLFKLYSEKIQ